MRERLERLPGFPTVFRLLDRYRLDAADQFAAAVGLFSFLALIPLLLLSVALLGYVYADPAEQVRIARVVTDSLPGFEQTLGPGGLEDLMAGIVERRGTITTIGLITLLLTALRPITAATVATTTIFRAPLPEGLMAKVRGVVALLALGLVAAGAVATSALIAADFPGVLRYPVSIGATFVLDVALFWTAYTMLGPGSRIRGRALLPGAALGAAGWTGLKLLGSGYVSGQVASANALYGAIGGTIAAILLLYLAGRLYLYGAEFAAVRFEQRHGPLPLPHGGITLAAIDQPTAQPARPAQAASAGPASRRDFKRIVGVGAGLAAVAVAVRLLRDADPS